MSFWGLTQQDGPWKNTAQDVKNLRQSKTKVNGGGIGVGGTLHAGHGNYESSTSIYQQNGRLPPPKMSRFASRSVIVKEKIFYPKPRPGVSQQVTVVAGGRPEAAYKMSSRTTVEPSASLNDEIPLGGEEEPTETEISNDFFFNNFSTETYPHVTMFNDPEEDMEGYNGPEVTFEMPQARHTFNNPMIHNPPMQGVVVGRPQINQDDPENILHFNGQEVFNGVDAFHTPTRSQSVQQREGLYDRLRARYPDADSLALDILVNEPGGNLANQITARPDYTLPRYSPLPPTYSPPRRELEINQNDDRNVRRPQPPRTPPPLIGKRRRNSVHGEGKKLSKLAHATLKRKREREVNPVQKKTKVNHPTLKRKGEGLEGQSLKKQKTSRANLRINTNVAIDREAPTRRRRKEGRPMDESIPIPRRQRR